TTQMKSVGEAMAIGRTFKESFQKALRSLEIGATGLDPLWGVAQEAGGEPDLVSRLRVPGARRAWYIADAFREGLSLDEVQQHTGIDPWFLAQIQELVEAEGGVEGQSLDTIEKDALYRLKRDGFSDARLASLLGVSEDDFRARRHALEVRPVYKRVDSCAGEFATPTAYLYSTYESECESQPDEQSKIMVLGGGPNRIGQGIEFDYCCVHAAMAMREDGYQTIMVNCNPETVSTDYDTSDRLYFEPLTLEDVLEICEVENPTGLIVQYGGQTPLKLSRGLAAAGVPILGTSPDSIHKAEDREHFQALINDLQLLQPPNRTATTETQALERARDIGYPLVVRPSYVLGGRAMEIVHSQEELERYLRDAFRVSNESPILLDRFLNDAVEVDVDAICDGDEVVIGGIMEHIEEAGVHSGDSACVLPPYALSTETQAELARQTRSMALALGVRGLMNVQFAVKGQDVYVLEVNPRASRTVPFVSKATTRPLAKIGARVMAGQSLADQGVNGEVTPGYYSVKEAVFPFIKFPGVDPILGPEMKSTGEVMGIGKTFGEAYRKAQLATGVLIPNSGTALISVRTADQAGVIDIAQYLSDNGFRLVATEGTAQALERAGLQTIVVNKVREGRPHVVDSIKNGEYDLIVNTTESRHSRRDSETIRRQALTHKVTYFTTLAAARAACEAHRAGNDASVNRLQTLHQTVTV
ncbi:MAG: carbamoyl-phosphate synthase large subunit, partial [Arenicellales bacterium]